MLRQFLVDSRWTLVRDHHCPLQQVPPFLSTNPPTTFLLLGVENISCTNLGFRNLFFDHYIVRNCTAPIYRIIYRIIYRFLYPLCLSRHIVLTVYSFYRFFVFSILCNLTSTNTKVPGSFLRQPLKSLLLLLLPTPLLSCDVR